MNRSALAVLLGLVMLLAACTSGLHSAVDDKEDGDVWHGTLRVALQNKYSLMSEPYRPGGLPFPIQERLAAFSEQYPGVEIEVLDVGRHADDLQKVLVDTDWVPDIIELSPAEVRHTAAGRVISLVD